MNETTVTLIGNVVTEVSSHSTPNGIEFSSFRMATTTRRFDRGLGQWVDGDTSFLKVTCWRRLGRNVQVSIGKGDPVVVTGHLKIREWTNPERKGVTVEVDASTVGHDLSRGTAAFTRVAKRDSAPEQSETQAAA